MRMHAESTIAALRDTDAARHENAAVLKTVANLAPRMPGMTMRLAAK